MDKIKEAQIILKKLGMPPAQTNEISALTLLALCGLGKKSNWENAVRKSMTISKNIMTFIAEKYNKEYAPNTRETFRRQVLHQFVQGRIVDYNPDNPGLPTNSPHVHYAIAESALKAIRSFGTNQFDKEIKEFIQNQGSLADAYLNKREKRKVSVILPDGKKIKLSPGKHNNLQALVISNFASRFIAEPIVLYLGDTARKNLHIEYGYFDQMNIRITEHGKLPDVVILDKKNDWIFLIEVVTSHGPMNPKRVIELNEMFQQYSHGLVYVSAFPDFAEFKKHSKDIAWETEVWIADSPEHMIHFNGDKFLGPRQ
jgi:type II restriction enzyme